MFSVMAFKLQKN